MIPRRAFIRTMGLGLLATGSGGPVPGAPAPATRYWTWTRVGADELPGDWSRRCDEFRAAGLTDVVLGSPTPAACAAAAAVGLRAHAWWWTLCRNDQDLLDAHPEWYAVSRDGRSCADDPPYVGYYRFLCPTRSEVRRYLRQRLADTLIIDGLAGVCLDYVRFPDVILPRALWARYDLVQDDELPRFDFCYCGACREAFRALEGVDPLDLPDPPRHDAWCRFRRDAVTRLVNELAAEARRHDRFISASVFPSPSIARRLVRQDWPIWELDAVLPMVYHSFYEEPVAWIEVAVREGVAALPASRPLYAALYLPALQDDGAFAEAVAGALAGGAAGIALFGGVRPLPAGAG